LILDDVLVDCDAVRKCALLKVIQAVSRERQVILFSQEDEVMEWARGTLRGPENGVVALSVR
jgi:hypothetical protein